MEWVETNYNIVDITEYEMMLDKRRSTENFVIKFFKNWESDDITNKLVVVCKDLVTDRRLQRMVNDAFTHSSLENFSRSFHNMCSQRVKESHIAALLAFSIVFDRTMKAQPWYSSSHLFSALVDSLIEASFDPEKFDWTKNHGNDLKTLRFPLLLILPPLLFLYYVYK